MFAQILKQPESLQTTRMGVAIIINAAIFQSHLSKINPDIPSPAQMCQTEEVDSLTVGRLWRDILKINYLPIFQLARQLIISIKSDKLCDDLLQQVFQTATKVAKQIGSQGLIGTIFGELIKDRKLLASFYTMPNPALLLSELSVSRLQTNWSEENQIKQLRVADLACGTGTLLLSVYKRIAERYMLFGNNPKSIHKITLEEIMIGCDVDPVAVHITAARLSGEHPEVDYNQTKIYAMPFGLTAINGINEYKIGSLDLLAETKTGTLFGNNGNQVVMPKTKPDIPRINKDNPVDIPNQSLDLIIMNPPFTRPTGHESDKIGIHNPAFAGLGNSKAEQTEMGKILKSHLSKINHGQLLASHGNAGLASNFMDLAHLKLKPGGVLALVLPITFISGKAWENTRRLVAKYYQDIVLISASSNSKYGRNWSSDTSLSEIMVVAKKANKEVNTKQARYATLNEQPKTAAEALEIAESINKQDGDGDINIGQTRVGWIIKDRFDSTGQVSGIANSYLAIFAKNLLQSSLNFPGLTQIDLPITTLGEIGYVGAYHADINGFNPDKTYRGAFDIAKLENPLNYKSVFYLTLWSHNTAREKLMTVLPDSEGRVRANMEDQAVETWQGYQGESRRVAGATRLHINKDFSTGSQSLGACLTPTIALGGRAWPSFKISEDYDSLLVEKIICLWLNTTIGLIGRWYISNRQQPGRSVLSISTIKNIPIIDINKLTKKQTNQLAVIFDKYANKQLKSAYLVESDQIRQELDKEVLVDVLNLKDDILEPLQIIRSHWSAESSVRGTKKQTNQTELG